MGTRYLVDSNGIIDYCNGRFPEAGRQFLEIVAPEISSETNIELFVTNNISDQEKDLFRNFVNISIIHQLATDLVDITLEIRQIHKIKLPDAIIAATAKGISLHITIKKFISI